MHLLNHLVGTANDHWLTKLMIQPYLSVKNSKCIIPQFKARILTVNSWDFWDTLVTRLVFRPADVFELMEIKTGISNFTFMRQKAEESARLHYLEPRLNLIYKYLPYDPELINYLMNMERSLEHELSSPISANIEKFSDQDIILSDMYLDKSDLLSIAKKNQINVKRDHLYISNELGVNKHSGELYKLLQRSIKIHSHIGDNRHSDFRMAIKNNIKPTFYKDKLTNIEKLWVKASERGKYIAGLLRASRLEGIQKKGISKTEEQIYSQILAPLLVAFVEWVFKESKSRQVKKLFFLARDGQIFYKIADEFLRHQKNDIEIVYLYASRQALHLPGFITIDEAETWILDNTSYLSLDVIADRTQVDIEKLCAISKKYLDVERDKNLSSQERVILKKLIRDYEFVQLLTKSSQSAFEITQKYLEQEGFFCNSTDNIAVIDLGWSGRMQKSLENIMEKSRSNKDRLFGFYFALDQNTKDIKSRRKFGYATDPVRSNFESKNDWILSNKEMFEFLLSANHPSTIGYKKNSIGQIMPNYGIGISEERKGAISFFHELIIVFTKKYCILKKIVAANFINFDFYSLEIAKSFILNPTYTQAKLFDGHVLSEHQIERDFKPIVKHLNIVSLLVKNNDFGLWAHGSVSLSRIKILFAIKKFVLHTLNKII